jgi:molybdate transport system regulatory protein
LLPRTALCDKAAGQDFTMKRAIRRKRTISIRPRVKVWLEADDRHVFCAGMCRILQAVDDTGSIKHAASRIGLSYRHVWARLSEAKSSLGSPLVESHVGGGDSNRSSLTPLGRTLLDAYLDLKKRLITASDACARKLQSRLEIDLD